MEQYKEEFIHFMVKSHVLKFGSFTLKSGRQSPFFMNAGAYVTGEQLYRLGKYYAQAIHDNFGLDFDVVFGPAYKGIPLAVVTAIALQELYGKEVRYCCNRKEVKAHGADKGNLLGAALGGFPRCARRPDHGVLSRRGRVAGAGGTDGDAGGQQRPGMRHPGELR